MSEILLDGKQQKVPLRTEDQSNVGLHMYQPGSCTATCIWLRSIQGVQAELENAVLSTEVPSVYLKDRIEERSHGPVSMLSIHEKFNKCKYFSENLLQKRTF